MADREQDPERWVEIGEQRVASDDEVQKLEREVEERQRQATEEEVQAIEQEADEDQHSNDD